MEQKKKQSELVEHLIDIYPAITNVEDNKFNQRYENIMNRFSILYGEEPTFFTRVPCFIQLFGDNHNDTGYGNISFCGEQDVVIAFSQNQISEILVNNVSPSVYPTQKISDFESTFRDNDDYYNTILIGIKSAICNLDSKQKKSLLGIKMVLDINFQKKRGLGWSNSIAMGICLTVIKSFKLKINYMDIIQNLQRYKNIVRPDLKFKFQETTLLLSENLKLLHLDKISLKQEPLNFPNQYCFVIADTLTTDPVFMTLGKRKDLRNCEIRIAIRLLLQKLQITDTQKFKTLYDIQKIQDYSLDDMIELFKKNVDDKPFKREELEEILECNLSLILKDLPQYEQVLNATSEFYPYKRGLHVLNESIIVQQAHDLLQDQTFSAQQKGDKLSEYMNESYKSFYNNLQCTCPQIEELRELLLQLGCSGVKMLGSGWDGSLIGLCEKSKADTVVEQTMNNFYINQKNFQLMITDDLSQYIFKTLPGRGAVILDPQYEIWFC